MHLAQQRHEQRRLTRTCRPNDQVEFALLEDELVINTQAECLPRGSDSAVRRLIRPCEVCPSDADLILMLSRAVDDDLFSRLLCEFV